MGEGDVSEPQPAPVEPQPQAQKPASGEAVASVPSAPPKDDFAEYGGAKPTHEELNEIAGLEDKKAETQTPQEPSGEQEVAYQPEIHEFLVEHVPKVLALKTLDDPMSSVAEKATAAVTLGYSKEEFFQMLNEQGIPQAEIPLVGEVFDRLLTKKELGESLQGQEKPAEAWVTLNDTESSSDALVAAANVFGMSLPDLRDYLDAKGFTGKTINEVKSMADQLDNKTPLAEDPTLSSQMKESVERMKKLANSLIKDPRVLTNEEEAEIASLQDGIKDMYKTFKEDLPWKKGGKIAGIGALIALAATALLLIGIAITHTKMGGGQGRQ